MDLVKLICAVMAVLLHPGSATKISGERICRRGTQRPCYKAFYIQDSGRRLSFEDATQACRRDGGQLLSIESESEQRLMERFISELRVNDGDFWIGLRRTPDHHRRGSVSPTCPSQYFWLDGSQAKYRNWHWDEPSCGTEMCVVLYHQPSASPSEEGRFLFQWNDGNCDSKNNFVCKYREDKVPVRAVPSVRPGVVSTTKYHDGMEIVQGSSVSLSESNPYVSYILYSIIPLLLLLFSVAGFFCYKQYRKRTKTESTNTSGRQKQQTKTATPSCPIQGPYAFSDISKLPHAGLDFRIPTNIMTSRSRNSQCDDYENVTTVEKDSGFVSNDIYESYRAQGKRFPGQTGWVENEIYG